MNVKSIKNLILIFILILIIIFIYIFFLKKLSKSQKIDDILFIKLFSSEVLNKNSREDNIINNQIRQEINKYEFKVSYKNIDFKTIDLLNTIKKETLVYDKIAPGTSGSFDILLNSNQSLKYKIEFYSINEKPKNLKFRAFKDDRIIGEEFTLEDLSKKLIGEISKNQNIKITINWYWDFENEDNLEISDIQDTKDAENIKTYQFSICTIGE